jgi:hypothetical protein
VLLQRTFSDCIPKIPIVLNLLYPLKWSEEECMDGGLAKIQAVRLLQSLPGRVIIVTMVPLAILVVYITQAGDLVEIA